MSWRRMDLNLENGCELSFISVETATTLQCFLCDFTCIDTCVRILCTNTILMLQELKNTKFKAHPPQVCMMKSFYCIWLQVRLVGLARHGTRKCILSEVVFVNLKKLLHVAINILYDTISHVEL